jgi:hypothetical protein
MTLAVSATESVAGAIRSLVASRRNNDTARALAMHPDAVEAIVAGLAVRDIEYAIPMKGNPGSSRVSLALYAGDGVVVKITDKSEAGIADDAVMPGVLPPVSVFDASGFAVEIYPWIDRHSVMQSDVAQMKKILADVNLKFRPGDDRTDNIGLLPGKDRKLAVLDNDAVTMINPALGVLGLDKRRWEKEVHARFSPLYKMHFPFEDGRIVSAQPNFDEGFSPLISRRAMGVANAGAYR